MIGQVIKEVREKKLMNQDDLAEATGLTKVAISNIERGFSKPRKTTIIKIAEALDIEPINLAKYL